MNSYRNFYIDSTGTDLKLRGIVQKTEDEIVLFVIKKHHMVFLMKYK